MPRTCSVSVLLSKLGLNAPSNKQVHNCTRREEGRKELFYLTTHSIHFILRLYGHRHIIKNHSEIERRNPLPPHGLFFSGLQQVLFYMHDATNIISHTTAFVTHRVVEHWLEREIAKWVHHEVSIRRPIANALTTQLHLSPTHGIGVRT